MIDASVITLLLDAASSRRLTIFIGSDLPAPISGLPSREEIAKHLVSRHSRHSQIQLLKDRLDPPALSPQPFDNLLARLPIKHFITTRYDRLLAEAFEEADRSCEIVVEDQDVAFVRPDKPLLIHLHGELRRPTSLVITEDDMLDIAVKKPQVMRLVKQAFSTSTILFLGHDLDSPDFLILWREVQRDLGRLAPMAYAAPSHPLPPGEVEVWRQRNITILEESPLAVVQALAGSLEPVGGPVKPVIVSPPPLPAARQPFESYRNFDLELAGNSGWVEARVLRSSEGEDEEAVAGLDGPPPLLDGVGSLVGLDEEIGYRLLPGRVAERWAAAQATADNAGEGVRLRLFVRDEAAAAIPWEAAKVNEQRPALRLQTPVVRYVNAARRAGELRVSGPLRLLVVLGPSAEIGLAPLDSNRERAGLEAALRDLQATGRVQIHWMEGAAASRGGLQDRLRRVQPHLLHFVGHGEYDEERRMGSLAFCRERDGALRADWVTTEELSILLDGLDIRFGLFNACQTGRAVGGVAHALVRSTLPAALGMQADVPDSAAIAFAGAFYRALSDRWPVDTAVVEGRKFVQGELGLDAPWWALPVLYMRAEDGKLFA